MTSTFLKSTTAIVLSLSLAVPSVTMAQTAAELEAALNVNTEGMTEAELDELRKQYAEQQQNALDQAVGAVTEEANELTNDNMPETGVPEASANNADGEVAPGDAAPAVTADTTAQPEVSTAAENGEVAPGDAAKQLTAETTTEGAGDAETTTTAESPVPEATSDVAATTEADPGEAGADSEQLQAQVDNLQKQLDALTNESAEETATREAASEAAASEAQATSMAATEGDTSGAQLVEETVTEETARSSTEEFATSASSTSAATQENRSSGLDELGRIALFGLGALAVGQMLKNGSEVVSNSGDRVVVQQPDGSYKVYKNDDVLMFQPGTDVKTYAYDDGSTRTIATREDGTQIETVRAADGTVLRRTRILANGDRVVLFDDTQVAEQVEVNQLPQVTEANRSINFQQAQEDELRAALQARMPQEVDRRFSLSQVRNITAVRDLVPEIDVDNITFETGSSTIRPEQAEELVRLGTLMRERIAENPGEVFLIEGHTDAVGSASYNLALSDRRAESVALALTEYFDVPPENMVVQGYGESDLKVRTALAEQMNRRAAVRRITPLLSGS